MYSNTPGAGRTSHYFVLDGLRGVAALCVVLFHFTEDICNSSPVGICHGFLAVDFFFCLSGFVLGHAYDSRMAKIGSGAFLRARLIRLHPMVVLGTVLGLLALYANALLNGGTVHATGSLTWIFTASILMVPSCCSLQEQAGHLFSLNPPSWSLLWEYVASGVYAVALYRFRRPALGVLTLVAAIALLLVAHQAGNLSGGWGASNFSVGGARVVFSFCAGLLLYRSGCRLRSPLGFAGLAFLLILAFLMPYAQGAWVRETAVIMLYFPLLVAIGAGTGASRRVERLCRLSGDLSYPLYMTHYAVVTLLNGLAYRHGLVGGSLWLVAVCGTLGTVGLSWVVLNWIDRPIRRYLDTRSQPRSG